MDLDGEFERAKGRITPHDLKWLKDRGVPIEGLLNAAPFDAALINVGGQAGVQDKDEPIDLAVKPSSGGTWFVEPPRGVSGLSFGVLEVEIQSDKSWMPMPWARKAVIIKDPPDERFEADELLAFFPQAPGFAYRRAGRDPIAGMRALHQAQGLGEPLYVWNNLLEWMIAAFQGVVVIDWNADLRGMFAGVSELRCADKRLGHMLQTALTRPYPCPPITIPEGN